MAAKQTLSTFIRIHMWSALEHEEVRVAISPFGGPKVPAAISAAAFVGRQFGHPQGGALAQPRPGRTFKK